MRRLLLLLSIMLPLACGAEEGDWGYAHVNFIKLTLADKWSILSRSQVTWRDDFNDFYFWYADAGLAYSFTPAWRADLAYRHARWDFGDGWLDELRPMLSVDWFGKLKGTRLNNRARIEYRYFDWDREEDWRFRNRTRAEFPWKVFGISPYMEEEFFIGYNRETVEMNWLTGGLQIRPLPRMKLKAAYRWIAIRVGDEWENRNQLVTNISLFF